MGLRTSQLQLVYGRKRFKGGAALAKLLHGGRMAVHIGQASPQALRLWAVRAKVEGLNSEAVAAERGCQAAAGRLACWVALHCPIRLPDIFPSTSPYALHLAAAGWAWAWLWACLDLQALPMQRWPGWCCYASNCRGWPRSSPIQVVSRPARWRR